MEIKPIAKEILVPQTFDYEDALDAVMYGLAKFNGTTKSTDSYYGVLK